MMRWRGWKHTRDNNNNSIKIESGLEVIKLFTSLTIALIPPYNFHAAISQFLEKKKQ